MSEQTIVTGFAIPEDGWFHIATPGEWPHKPTGLVQVLDDEAMQSIVDGFTEHSEQPNWPGVLIDFDHQSLDQDKPTVAAGWITLLEKRPTGIWAQIKWSDIGRECIEGGRYRFISPVWNSSDCAKLGEDRIRPLKLMNCAVTNDPNIKGMFPLSNSGQPDAQSISAPAMPIPNARYRTEDERKAMFATMMGGGGGGGRGGGARPSPASGGGRPPPPQPDPATPPAGRNSGSTIPEPRPAPDRPDPGWWERVPEVEPSRRSREYKDRIQQLEKQRLDLDRDRPVPPAPPDDLFERINPREAMREAMRQPGNTTFDGLAARDFAEAENRRRTLELRELRDQFRRQYSTSHQQERALQRELDKREQDYSRDMERWHREQNRIDREVRSLDQNIHRTRVQLASEHQRQEDRNWRDHRNMNREEIREHEQAVRARIQADIHNERLRQYDERQQTAPSEPQEDMTDYERRDRARQEYRRTRTSHRDFYEAVRTGNENYARRIFPDADIAAARQLISDFDDAHERSNTTVRRNAWNDISAAPPPMKER